MENFCEDPPQRRPFNMADLLKSPDKIAYMNKYDRITIGRYDYIFEGDRFLLNPYEFRVFASKCDNLIVWGYPLMEYACKNNDLSMVKCLAENGINTHNIGNACCTTMRHIGLASANGDEAIPLVNFLIENSTCTWCANYFDPRMHEACKNGNGSLKIVSFLIEKGANVNEVVGGETPLISACESAHDSLELVELLIKNGADVNHLDSYGLSPLFYACKKGDEAIALVELLMKNGANPNLDKWRYRHFPMIYFPIQAACVYKGAKLIKYLVENGADVCVANRILLIEIICKKYNVDESLELIKYLVDHGLDVNSYGYNRRYPINAVCELGDSALPLVKYLASVGADLNCVDNDGERPIHYACRQGRRAIKIIKFLIGQRVDVGAASRYGRTPSSLTYDVEIRLLLAAERLSQFVINLRNSSP